MSVEKRNGKYLVRWRDSAGQQRSKSVQLWRDAITLDGEMKRKRAMGELIAHEKGTIRLCDFWDVYVVQYAIPNLSPRTRDVYSSLYSKHISTAIGSQQLRQISTEQVASWSARLSSTLAPSSVRQCLSILQGVLERAVEWDYIPSNPAKGIRKPKLVQREGRALTLEQISALRKELDLRSSAIVAVLAGTGMRPGELRALEWGDVRGVHASVTKAVSSDAVGPTKTNRLRRVPMADFVYPALREWFVASMVGISGLIFPSCGDVNRLWTDQGWRMWQRQVFRPAAARAGLAGLRPYDLRHTFASQRIAEGADILTLANQLGHSPTMTLTVYGHLLGSKSVYSECNDEAVQG